MKFIGFLILTLILTGIAQAQTCTGNFGDAVVNLDFGSGSNPAPTLSTNYTYTSNNCPPDGSYTITNSTPGCFGNRWHNITQDHTPGDTNGFMMLVNASFSQGEFFKQSINDLCPGTTYEFAAYVLNVLRPFAPGIKPNLTFIIESADGTSLGRYLTGDIIESASPDWKKHAMIFTTPPGISQIILKIINNAPGGNGNDLALDDITFRACGPTIQATVNGSQGSFSVCEGQSSTISLSLEANVSPGLSNPAYQWQANLNNSGWKDLPGANSKTSTLVLNRVAGAVYQYRVAVAESLNINSIKCRILSEPVSAKLIVNANVDFEVPDFCLVGGFAQFTNTTTISDGTEAQLTYLWDFGDAALANAQRPNTSTIKNASHRYTKAGSYTVKLTVKSVNGCEKTISKLFVVNIIPDASFAFSTIRCETQAIQFTDKSIPNEGVIVKWNWDFGDGKTSAEQNPLYAFAAAGKYIVKLTVETDKGCLSTPYTTEVTVNPSPKVDFEVPDFCLADGSAQFTNTTTISDGTEAQLTYLWDFGDAALANTQRPNTSTLKNAAHRYTKAGRYTVKLTVKSANGCEKTISKPFVVNGGVPKANFSVKNPDLLCSDKPVEFEDNVIVELDEEVTKIEWIYDFVNFPNLKEIDDNPAIRASPSRIYPHKYPAFTSPASKTFEVRMLAYTGGICVNIITKTITVLAVPSVDFELPPSCLINGTASFKDKSSIAGTNGPFTYLWDFGDKNASADKPNTSTEKDPEHRYSVAGDYMVKLTVTSQAGCSTTLSKTLTVAGSIPIAALTVLTPDKLCSDTKVIFEDRTTLEFGEITKIEWYYDYTNNPLLKFTDDSIPKRKDPSKKYSYTYPVFFTPATKTVTVRMVAFSGTSCIDEELQTITLHAVPRVQFGSIPDICSDAKPIQLTQAKEIYGVLTGTGTYSGKGVTPTGLFNQAIVGVGTHTLTYTFVADNGCSDFKTQTITVNEIPTATIIPKQFVLDGGRIKLPAVATGNNLTYKWTPSTYLDKDDILMPVTTPTDDITYTLTVTTDKGCIATTQIFIKVLKFPEVPNSFTPNGDGTNDTWNVKYLESYPDATVHIFNRYGEKLFQIVNYLTPWDGTKNGSDLPVGTYYYIINPQNGRKIISGSVTIIR